MKAVVIEADEVIATVQTLHQQLLAQKEPLLLLAESLQTILHTIPNLRDYINTTLMNCMNPANDLTSDESAAIQIYTMEWKPSESTIKYLLNKDLCSKSKDALTKWFSYLNLFLHALNKLPSYKGTVWRCISGDITQQFPNKSRGVWWGISSTTSNMSILQPKILSSDNGMRALLSIECTNGKRIAKHSYFPMADEILLLPGFSFEVGSQLDVGNGLHIITLREVASSQSSS